MGHGVSSLDIVPWPMAVKNPSQEISGTTHGYPKTENYMYIYIYINNTIYKYKYGPRSIFGSKSSIFEECIILFQVLVYKQMLSFFEECIIVF